MIEVEGLKINESEFVYKPAEDSFLAMKAIKKALDETEKQDIDVLDVGTGTGILGLYAAKVKQLNSLTVSDINEHARKLAEENFELNKESLKCKTFHAIRSDLFENLEGEFGLIIFNAPYLRGSISASILSKAWNGGREGVEVSIRFLSEAMHHLKEGGIIILTASSLSNFKLLENKIGEMGYYIHEIIKEHYFFEDIMALTIERKP